MDKQELLDKYFEKTLTDAERAAFDALLNTDADFRADFEFQTQLKQAITANERQKLKKQLREIENNENQSNGNKQYWFVAALLIVFLAITLVFTLQQPSEQELYASYFQAYPNIIETNTRTANANRITTRAFEAYENENYTRALQGFSNLSAADRALYGDFYRGMCFLALKQPENAIRLFNRAQSSKNTQLAKSALWYQALAYLQLNQADNAVPLLKQIALDKNHPQYDLAQQLLAEL
ncbi:hypothetical protein [Flavobacterium sp.]|uniref:tetratricopeptide repeat protein n=1 Tax=Flavobacterium sp. TaxID=239 RepID=UPI0026245B9B|nr:hypothetical protein [Flavobacterium sp.]